MLLKINPETPQERKLSQAVELLRQGGLLIYPTDTVYGIGCDVTNKRAVERVHALRGTDPAKTQLSCLCSNLSILGEYTTQVDTPTFKLIKRLLPGPYTLILNASREVPRHFQSKRKTVGIRLPEHNIPRELVERLGRPIVTASLKHEEDELLEYRTNPELIHEKYKQHVDAVIDGGYGGNVPSTVIDLSEGVANLRVLREGKGLDALEPVV